MPSAPPLAGAVQPTLIEDRYLLGTRLRLRRMTPVGGGPARLKLGQKVRPDPAVPGLVMMTNLYLSAEEYELLARLPGADLCKVRHLLVLGARRWGVDLFDGRHAGLALVEVELSGADDAVAPPPFAGAEVTGDERYSGGWLAFAPAGALAGLLTAPRRGPAGSPPG